MDSKEDKDEAKNPTDPGACRYGNFMNYYQFHPAEERARQLPRGVWQRRRSTHPTDRKYIGLDVGCNAGDLTLVLEKFLKEELQVEVHLLGVDLDPILIERAQETSTNNVSFQCLNFMSKNRDSTLTNYLTLFERTRFDVAFCFAITMWIHLNYGDAGLIEYLEAICACSNMVVIEPQLWKCYRNASRRMRRAGADDFSLINSLKLTGDVASHIDRIVTDQCGFQRVTVTVENEWGRKLHIYKRTNDDEDAPI